RSPSRATTSTVSADGPHLELHSFPTRRSSDLDTNLPPKRPDVTAALQAGVCLLESRRSPPPRTLVPDRPHRAVGRERSGDEAASDRKSTRLNSSHGSTSYAVFCLNKRPEWQAL